MKIKDALIIGATAVTTMAVTLALLLPTRVDANAPSHTVKPLIAQPKLVAGNCTFTLKTDKQTYKPGETPRVIIQASNPTDKSVDKAIWVNMSSTSPTSQLSRVVIRPFSLWRKKCSINLKPGETKTIALDTGVKLPSSTIITLSMTDNKQAVVGARLPIMATKQLTARPQFIAGQGK